MGRSVRRSLAAGLLGICAGVSLTGDARAQTPPPFEDLFTEAEKGSGLSFKHQNGADGQWHFPEINGSGVALFDYDNDGDLDVYLVQGGPVGPVAPAEPQRAARQSPSPRPMDRLFRNDLHRGKLTFVDVTKAVGLRADAYGMAVLTADFDNDGWIDIYLGGYGANQLWRNLGPQKDGETRFEDVTRRFQADDRRWTAALTVLDVDGDGRLDLYLGNYLRFETVENKVCTVGSGRRDYCHPSSFPAVADLLFQNRQVDGETRFIDITRRAFGTPSPEPTLGAVAFDADNDGHSDLYLAHDDRPNRLWRFTDGNGPTLFQEEALLTGLAVNARGHAEASMGVTAADFDNDGDDDLFISHLDGQTNTFYVNDGGVFRDQTRRLGLGAPSLPFTGFGTRFFDPDLDGDLDLFVVNGAVQVLDALARVGDSHPFHQTNQLFENRPDDNGNIHFIDATSRGGAPFRRSEVGRGAAVGDLDNDGDPDVVAVQNNGPARIWLNQTLDAGSPSAGSPAPDAPWLGLRLIDPNLKRDALGARVRLRLVSPKSGTTTSLFRRVAIDGSYASSSDPRLIFGLRGVATDAVVDLLEVTWPDGRLEVFAPPPRGRYTTLARGQGRPPAHDGPESEE